MAQAHVRGASLDARKVLVCCHKSLRVSARDTRKTGRAEASKPPAPFAGLTYQQKFEFLYRKNRKWFGNVGFQVSEHSPKFIDTKLQTDDLGM